MCENGYFFFIEPDTPKGKQENILLERPTYVTDKTSFYITLTCFIQ